MYLSWGRSHQWFWTPWGRPSPGRLLSLLGILPGRSLQTCRRRSATEEPLKKRLWRIWHMVPVQLGPMPLMILFVSFCIQQSMCGGIECWSSPKFRWWAKPPVPLKRSRTMTMLGDLKLEEAASEIANFLHVPLENSAIVAFSCIVYFLPAQVVLNHLNLKPDASHVCRSVETKWPPNCFYQNGPSSGNPTPRAQSRTSTASTPLTLINSNLWWNCPIFCRNPARNLQRIPNSCWKWVLSTAHVHVYTIV